MNGNLQIDISKKLGLERNISSHKLNTLVNILRMHFSQACVTLVFYIWHYNSCIYNSIIISEKQSYRIYIDYTNY